MKKIIALILCVGLFGLTIFAQSGRTRPRVVVTDNLPSPSQTPAQPSEVEPTPTDSPSNAN